MEYEEDTNGFLRHRFLVFDGPRLYSCYRVLRRIDENDASDLGLRVASWFTGSLYVTTSDDSGDPLEADVVMRVANLSDTGDSEDLFGGVKWLLRLGQLFMPGAALLDAERTRDAPGGNMRFGKLVGEETRVMVELESGRDRMPVAISFVSEDEKTTYATYRFEGWYRSFGLLFPSEVNLVYYGAPGRDVKDRPVSIRYKIIKLYSVNQRVNPMWFIPRLRVGSNVAERMPDGTVFVWEPGFQLDELRHWLPAHSP